MADENMGFETRELTEEQKKQIKEAMDKFADTRDEKKILAQAREMKNQKLEQVREDVINYIKTIDKSSYAHILNNDKVSEAIWSSLTMDDAITHARYEDQVNRLYKIYTDHVQVQQQRAEITEKANRGANLTGSEHRLLKTKTQLESSLDRQAELYFADKKHTLRTLLRRGKDSVLYSARNWNEQQVVARIKQQINQTLYHPSFEYIENELPAYYRDEKALQEYAKTLLTLREENLKELLAETEYRAAMDKVEETGDNWRGSESRIPLYTVEEAEELTGLPREKISQAMYDNLNIQNIMKIREGQRLEYEAAVKRLHEIEAYREKNPKLMKYKESEAYAKLLKLEYYEGKYDMKTFDKVPAYEQKVVQSIMLSHLDKQIAETEQKLEEYWAAHPNNPVEQEYQKQELEENRAIISAYKNYVESGSKESKEAFLKTVEAAYESAKQRYVNGDPFFREHLEKRTEQLREGDFSFVPVQNPEHAKAFNLAGKWDSVVYGSDALNAMQKMTFMEQYQKASIEKETAPVKRLTISSQIDIEIQERPEYTLNEMGASLKGEALEEYKNSVSDREKESSSDMKDFLGAQIDETKQKREDLKKQYGFFQRFSKEYRTQKSELDKTVKDLEKSKKLLQDKTRYNILKTYNERGIKMSMSERMEFKKLTKSMEKGDLKNWEQTKALIEKANEPTAVKAEEKPTKEPVVRQLDISDKLYKAKEKEAPVKEETQVQKTVEKEERVQEGPDL